MYDWPEIIEAIVKGQFLLQGNNYLWFCIAIYLSMALIFVMQKYKIHPIVILFALVVLHFGHFKFKHPIVFGAFNNAIYLYIGCLLYQERRYVNNFFNNKALIFVFLPILLFTTKKRLLLLWNYSRMLSNLYNKCFTYKI